MLINLKLRRVLRQHQPHRIVLTATGEGISTKMPKPAKETELKKQRPS